MDERSRSVEVSARSVEEAVDEALEQLGLGYDEVEVEVLKQGSRGLLGLLSEAACVRVTAKTAQPALATTAEQAAQPQEGDEPPQMSAEDLEETARLGAEVLQELLERMGIQARVVREKVSSLNQGSPDTVLLNVSGQGLGILIGRRGETLRDLQFLTSLIVSRRTQRWPGLMIDVEHYKSRREKSLIDLARRMADQVRATGQSVPLEPMPPHERRIVHLTLRDDEDVFTESVGQDDRRKVVILPKK